MSPKYRHLPKLSGWFAAISLLVGVSACELGYLSAQARGQLELLLAAQPVNDYVRQQSHQADAWRWALAWSAREFARQEMGLSVDNQYERAVALDRDAVAWVVNAARRYDLETYHWWFPVVGNVPYKGFFDEADAHAEADRLAAEGYDVFVRPVSTYSLLGFYPDPLLSTMVQARPERIVETVIHELAHATVYVPGQGEFNEGLATFIGRRGRQEFIAKKLGASSVALQQALDRDADSDRFREATMALSQDLASFYVRGVHLTEVNKQQIFLRHQQLYDETAKHMKTTAYRAARLPANNAEVAAHRLYSFNGSLYTRAFASVGGNWQDFIALLQDAAPADEPQLALEQSVRMRLAQRATSLQLPEK